MNDWFIVVILLPVVLAEIGELAPWLARRCVAWGARRLGDTVACERYSQEWRADLDQIPGKVTKLGYAAGIVVVSLPRLRLQQRRNEREVPGMRAAAIRAVAALDRAETADVLADLIAASVVCTLGFAHVAVNVTVDDSHLRCVAAIGPQEMVDVLLGESCPRSSIDMMLANSTVWGTLRLAGIEALRSSTATVYTFQGATYHQRADAWRSDYSLLVPLYAPKDDLLGILSLDVPSSGLIPGPAHRAAIEMFAARAATRLTDIRLQISSPPTSGAGLP